MIAALTCNKDHITFKELMRVLCNLSYQGDIRSGWAEDAKKLDRLVEGQAGLLLGHYMPLIAKTFPAHDPPLFQIVDIPERFNSTLDEVREHACEPLEIGTPSIVLTPNSFDAMKAANEIAMSPDLVFRVDPGLTDFVLSRRHDKTALLLPTSVNAGLKPNSTPDDLNSVLKVSRSLFFSFIFIPCASLHFAAVSCDPKF